MAQWELLLCLTFPLAEDCNTVGAAPGAGHGALARIREAREGGDSRE